MAAGDTARFTDLGTSIPKHSGVPILPANRERLIDLHILTGFDAAATKDALVWIITIKRIGIVYLVRFRGERNPLMLNSQKPRGVVDRAIPIVIVADSAVQQVITEEAVKRFFLGAARSRGFSDHLHTVRGQSRAGADQFPIRFNQTSVTRLNRAKLGMIADLWDLGLGSVDQVDQTVLRPSGQARAIDRYADCHRC
jgi:hypothetical protein